MISNSITLIIPVRNEEEKIERCLKAVFEQTIAPIEVLVIDGRSSDNTVPISKKFPVKVFYEDYHTRAGACQVGIENARGEFIAFTDADCIPERNWLENLNREFGDGIAGVGGGIRNIGQRLWENSINLSMESFLGSANSVQGRIFKNKKFVNSISGCNSLYRRDDLFKIGGFNVKLLTAEDTDLSKKMLGLGKLVYTPNAIVMHNHKRGLKAFAKRMYQYGYGRSKSGLFDLQVIPPLFALLLLVSSVFSPKIILSMICLYFVLILTMGIKISLNKKNLNYLYSIPIVLIIEHVQYTFGFWKGLIR